LVRNLGVAYADATGDLLAGTWQITHDAAHLVTQQIRSVSRTEHRVTSTFMLCQLVPSSNACEPIFPSAGASPLAIRTTLGLSAEGGRIALAAGTLSMQASGSETPVRLADASGVTTPAWSQDGRLIAVTQVISAGQPRTSIRLYKGGASGTVLVLGGQGLAWRP
jgi:hypothetical protein